LRAIVLEQPGMLHLAERLEPVAGPGEALVRIKGTGVCGTDVSIFRGKIPVQLPRVLGHEMVGVIEKAATGLEAGTRVVVDPNLSCGTCYQCSRGQSNVCANSQLMGRDRDGALCDVIAAPVQNIYPVPDSIDDRIAPLFQVLTVCLHGQRQTPIFPQASVLVLGLGVTGLLHLQLAKARGAHPLIGITRSGFKRSLAEELGADLTIDYADPDLASRVADATHGRGPDVVIECVGNVETLARSIELARVGGHVTVYGTITATEGALPFYQLYYKELSLSNPRAAKAEDFPECIGLAASGKVKLEPLITNTFPLESAQHAIQSTAEPETLKVMLDYGGGV
jgi:2-desacetyl-2-hydroxyethyl bacteriochlorophyllide A dehydrogenase